MKLDHFRRLELARQQEHRRKVREAASVTVGVSRSSLPAQEPSAAPAAASASEAGEVSRAGLSPQAAGTLEFVLGIWDKAASMSRARLQAELAAHVGVAVR